MSILPRGVPVTLVAGFSVTWREVVVASMAQQHPGSVVVEVHRPTLTTVTITAVDAGRHQLLDATTLQLDHGCVSCTIVAQLPRLLRQWATNSRCRLIVGLPAAMEPTTLRHTLEGAAGVDDTLTLNGVVTAVDAVLLSSHLSGDDLVVDRGLAAADSDRRSVAEVVSRQVENSDVVVLCNMSRLSQQDRDLVTALVSNLEPGAKIVVANPAGRWPVPQDAEPCQASDRVTTVVWWTVRPFHPSRFAASVERIVEPLVRSRGEICLANRPVDVVSWESAGASAAIGVQGERDRTRVNVTELTLVGVDLDRAAVTSILESCLLTDEEFASGPDCWRRLEDPFADALGCWNGQRSTESLLTPPELVP
jgi:G3E family GTPase